jgi:hypothetical protein
MTAEPQARTDGPRTAVGDSDWESATRLSYGVSRVRTRRVDGAVAVRAYGGGQPRPGDWGEVAADGVFALTAGSGYALTATFDGAAISSHLQTNQVHGVMSVHAFHRFTDGSGGRDYYTREFYVPATPSGHRPPVGRGAEPPAGTGLPSALLTGANDPGGLLGTWTALDRENMRIPALECTLTGGGFTVRAFGATREGPLDWGTTRAHVYADAAAPFGPPAFLATFERDDRRVHLQFRPYNGIAVVAEYTAFTDGSGRPDFYARECYRR